MVFKDFKDLEPNPLMLPINGKTYKISPVSAADGLRVWKYIRTGKKSDGTDAKVEDIAQLLLGTTHRQLIADNISYRALNRVYTTVIADFTNGRAAAELMWETNGSPKALDSILETNSPVSEKETTIQQPDSMNGTKTSHSKLTQG